jgi:hypothetical protein
LARLQAGDITAEAFDYNFLRQKAGRFGSDALEALATHQYGPVAAVYAERVRSGRYSGVSPTVPLPPIDRQLANMTVVYPKGADFPRALLEQNWSSEPRRFVFPRCMTADARCNAVLIDLDGDGIDEVLLFGAPGGDAAFKQHDDKTWRYEGGISNSFCPGFRDALSKGEIAIGAPRFKDIEVAGQRASIGNTGCAPVPRQAAPRP